MYVGRGPSAGAQSGATAERWRWWRCRWLSAVRRWRPRWRWLRPGRWRWVRVGFVGPHARCSVAPYPWCDPSQAAAMVALAVFRVAGCAQWRMLPWGPVRVGVPLDGKAPIAEAACDAAAVDAGAVEGRSITPRKDLHRDPRRPPVLCSSGLPVLCSSGHIPG